MMQKLATPLVTATFIGIATTGILMLFHLGGHPLKEAHEHMGILFIVAALVHAWKHRKNIGNYVRKPLFLASVAIVVLFIGVHWLGNEEGNQERHENGQHEGHGNGD